MCEGYHVCIIICFCVEFSGKMSQDVVLGLMIGIWWVAYCSTDIISSGIITTNDSTAMFSSTNWVELTALQLVAGAVISMVIVNRMGKSIRSSPAFENKKAICMAALGHVLGSLAANAAYTVVTSTVQLAVLACQPLFTFILTCAMSRGSFSNVFQLLMIVLGVVVFGLKDSLLNIWGLATAVASITAFTTRNVIFKEKGGNSLESFMAISSVSAILVLPVWLVQVVATQTIFASGLWQNVLASILHPAYSLASFQVLSIVSPVLHAMVAVLIRVLFCMKNLVIPPSDFTLSMMLGCLTIILGFFLSIKHISKERSALFLFLLFALNCLALHYYPGSNTTTLHYYPGSNTTTLHYYPGSNTITVPQDNIDTFTDKKCTVDNSTTISVAWIYQKPIPKNVITNIGDLADSNLDMGVLVYCGTTQCVNAVEKLHRDNVMVEFAVIGNIVKDTPLERWVARHPINKLLAGKEFEKHLQEVMILGLMWQNGGFYVNPMVRVGNLTLPACRNATSVWDSKEVALPERSLPSVLDLLYFSRQHVIIMELAETFVNKYPRSLEQFPFDFVNSVWKRVEGSIATFDDLPLERVNLNSKIVEDCHYGTLAQGYDLDSQIEHFAGLQFLPYVDTFIDGLQPFSSVHNVTVFANGLFNVSEKLRRYMNPIMLSVEVRNDTRGTEIDYLKSKEPIGCRDVETFNYLRANSVKVFSPSFLMLLMNTLIPDGQQRQSVYLMDVEEEHVKLLPPDIQKRAIHMDQEMKQSSKLNGLELSQAAYHVIEEYGSAKLVITGNIQHALLCVALRTPVLFFHTVNLHMNENYTTSQLTDIFGDNSLLDLYALSNVQAKEWLSNYRWDDPPLHLNIALLMRLKATAWNIIRKNQDLHDAARKFSLIPMKSGLTDPSYNEDVLTFHLIFTTSQKDKIAETKSQTGQFNWRHWRSIESIFHHHPNAQVVVHSNTLQQSLFDVLTEAGYSIQVQRYNLKELLVGTPAESFLSKLDSARKGRYWYSNEGNLLRMLILFQQGGIYMDIDIYVTKSLQSLKPNSIGWQDKFNSTLNGAFLKFEKGNSFLLACLNEFAAHYDGNVWGRNGPKLLTRVYHELMNKNGHADVNVVNYKFFYMIHYSDMIKKCFMDAEGREFDDNFRILKTEAYVFHTNSKISGHIGLGMNKLKEGTICSYILNVFCVLCDQFH